jgi:serine phosphatase RsbU (regulator of sigma subunit)
MTAVVVAANDAARILIVDDTESNRDLLSRRLEKQGHVVAAVEGGAAALERLRAEPFDLVLLDIMMPDMNGYEVLERLKADRDLRHLPVIMITAITEMESVVRCIELGAEDHLPKPFNATLLRARIESSLARKRLRDREQVHARALERELAIGRNIQASFLPEELPSVPGWEIAAKVLPARTVAGDFYDAFPLRGGERVALVVGDVCDKGVGAALFMAVFRSLLRVVAAETFGAAMPGSADGRQVARTLRVLSDYNARTHARANMFATVFFGVLDGASGRLAYVNAGHDPPAILRGGAVLQRLAPTGAAVGLLPGLEWRYEEVVLEPGDTLLAFTDGVTDARAPSAAMFGEARLFETAAAAGGRAGPLVEAVEAAVQAHIASADPFDDITLLAAGRLS